MDNHFVDLHYLLTACIVQEKAQHSHWKGIQSHSIGGNTSQNTENNNSDISATCGCLHSLMKAAAGC